MGPLAQFAVATAAILLLVYLYRADFEKYSIFTVGVYKRVTHAAAEDTDVDCYRVHCESTVTNGEVRRRYKEIVIAGCPIVRYGGGASYHCQDHTSWEFSKLDDVEDDTRELSESILSAFVSFLQFVQAGQLELPDEDESEFANATSSVGTAMNLAGPVLLILIAAVILKLVNAAGVSK
jgi:hypothetical protein